MKLRDQASRAAARASRGSLLVQCLCVCQTTLLLAFGLCLIFFSSRLLSSQSNCVTISSATSSGQGAEYAGTDLRLLETAWNHVNLGAPHVKLRIAAFVRKWPNAGAPGGLERHAFTLHQFLADRGHDVHMFTSLGGSSPAVVSTRSASGGKLTLHSFPLPPPNAATYDQSSAWEAFLSINATSPFHVIHTESVALHHTRAALAGDNLVASWHGIAFEVIHSDIVSDLLRPAHESRSQELTRTLSDRLFRVSDEIRFFSAYKHHVAISDFVGEVLRTVYQIPTENVHVILNGVDAGRFRPEPPKGTALRRTLGISDESAVVLGVAGRLVKDKGHPLLIDVLPEFLESSRTSSNCSLYLLVAGDGPWATRYREAATPCVKVLGPMNASQMAEFYNAIDVFVNPTLRAQGLDLTLLEAMMTGKPLLATRFSSITRSVVVGANSDVGYTFSPNVESLAAALRRVLADGRQVLAAKGVAAHRMASQIFTSSKMGLAYERLFLCITHQRYCYHPLDFDSAQYQSYQTI